MAPNLQLFTPGPTPVPLRIRNLALEPMIHHRSDEFAEILHDLRGRLNAFYKTDGDVVVLSSSGTGGLEAAIASLFSHGDEVVVVEAGKFGQRLEDMSNHYGLNATVLRVPWGQAVSVSQVRASVTASTKAIILQACESSTGVFHPIHELGSMLKEHGCMLVVDGITAVGVHDLDMVRDHIDVLIGASQKAFMCPPGLALVGLSQKAVAQLRKKSMSYYFCLRRELEAQKKNATAFTPAITLCIQLREALRMIDEEGREALFARHRLMQAMARKAFKSLEMELFNSDDCASMGITVVRAPAAIEVKPWLKRLRKDYGLWLAGGQDRLDGIIFRMSHMGAIQPEDLIRALETIETSIEHIWPHAKARSGSRAAKTVWETPR